MQSLASKIQNLALEMPRGNNSDGILHSVYIGVQPLLRFVEMHAGKMWLFSLLFTE